jgi:hypothetical protein
MPYLGKSPAVSATPSTVAASTTAGDGTAEDTKILFDGNALDFRIGIDDGTDTLEIGKGSAHGTTAHMIFDTNGIIRKPLQPAFHVRSPGRNNIAHNTTNVVETLNNEIIDTNGDFDTSNYTFTAPVTGSYLLACNMRWGTVLSSFDYYNAFIETSNRNHEVMINTFDSNENYYGVGMAVVADMDAADTAVLKVFISSTGSGNTNSDVGTPTKLSGYLIG